MGEKYVIGFIVYYTVMQDEIIPVVNLDDEIIWYKSRNNITTDDIYRVSACRIRDADGNILLAQRSFTKKNNPWKRWPAVAGTVSKDETYLQNIIKEIKEEISIDATEQNLTVWPKQFRDWEHRYFRQWYVLIYIWPKDVIQPEVWAVEQLKRFTPQELKEFLTSNRDECLTSLERCFNNL